MATDRADEPRDDRNGEAINRALIGAAGVAGVAAAAGVAWFLGRRMMEAEKPLISDAPASAFRGRGRGEALVARTVTVARPAVELFDFWRDFTNLPRFMDNVRSVERIDDERSRWTIEGPAGSTVEFVSRITEEAPGRLIAWESEEGADVANRGRVEFIAAAPGRGTMVRATIAYDPPAGTLGRFVAKILQREPEIQARRDLRRFKQLIETGEIASSAGPSARAAERPDRQYL